MCFALYIARFSGKCCLDTARIINSKLVAKPRSLCCRLAHHYVVSTTLAMETGKPSLAQLRKILERIEGDGLSDSDLRSLHGAKQDPDLLTIVRHP